jgi:hypothetical protein
LVLDPNNGKIATAQKYAATSLKRFDEDEKDDGLGLIVFLVDAIVPNGDGLCPKQGDSIELVPPEEGDSIVPRGDESRGPVRL